MATPGLTSVNGSASELVSQFLSDLDLDSRNSVASRIRDATPSTQQGVQSRTNRYPSIASNELQDSTDSVFSAPTDGLVLNNRQLERLKQFIELEYKALQRSEIDHCYYLSDPSKVNRAIEDLQKAPNGSFFVRQRFDEKFDPDVRYILHFVCHKEVAALPICCDSDHRKFWFLSGHGHGSEVKLTYSGIDLMIQYKKANRFSELQYPFQICLYQPLNSTAILFLPLPDEVRALTGRSTILHEFASRGLIHHYKQILRISRKKEDPLHEKCFFIVNKINARNERGQTPLILAIINSDYEFIECLLDNKANVNTIDTEGCSPLQHACRQANPRILEKLIARGADIHYVNPRKSNNSYHLSNLSALHYLAMADKASVQNIQRCVNILLEHGVPLMPMTLDGKTPFQIAELYNSRAFDCVKKVFTRRQYNQIFPVEVSSRNQAKSILANFACRKLLNWITIGSSRRERQDCVGRNGLFLIYETKQTRNSDKEIGLCVHYNGKIYLFPITQKYQYTLSGIPDALNMLFRYSLTLDWGCNDHARGALFRSYEELCYTHTIYQGFLPCRLKCFIRLDNRKPIVIDAETILVLNSRSIILPEPEPEPEPPLPPSHSPTPPSPTFISDSIDPRKISRLEVLHENVHRLICLAEIRQNGSSNEGRLTMIIKDYLPEENVDEYKTLRLNQSRSNTLQTTRWNFTFSNRVRLEYQHESKILHETLSNNPFIVHAFQSDPRLDNDFRLFMEYLPLGSLHKYLINLDPRRFDPLSDSYHWIYQLAQAMGFLARKKIVHRDLATRNILLRSIKHIKLSDFGLSRDEGDRAGDGDCILPVRWSAPECFERNHVILCQSDVWSFGVVIWEIYSFGELPYGNKISSESPQLLRELKNLLINSGDRLNSPPFCSAAMYDLMQHCWNLDLKQRPGIVDVIEILNGRYPPRHSYVTFDHEERRAWTQAGEQYLNLAHPHLRGQADDPGYIRSDDSLNDDSHYIGANL